MTHFYESLFADDAARPIAAGCFVLTVALYFVSKRVYARFHQPWLTPLLTVPVVLVAIVLGARIPYPVYFADTRWLMWLLGPATVAFAVAILAEAALSYLGLGTPPPTPSWGRTLSESQTFLNQAPLLAVWPGASIALSVLGFNLLGDGLRDLLDPKLIERVPGQG